MCHITRGGFGCEIIIIMACGAVWSGIAVVRFGFNVNERCEDGDLNNLGYVHRFPDLLKRWDDVDGDRGTW